MYRQPSPAPVVTSAPPPTSRSYSNLRTQSFPVPALEISVLRKVSVKRFCYFDSHHLLRVAAAGKSARPVASLALACCLSGAPGQRGNFGSRFACGALPFFLQTPAPSPLVPTKILTSRTSNSTLARAPVRASRCHRQTLLTWPAQQSKKFLQASASSRHRPKSTAAHTVHLQPRTP